MAADAAKSQDTSEEMKQAIRDFSFKDFGKTLAKRFQKDRVTGLAAQVAYHMVFAIPPLIILLVTLAAIVNATTGIGVTDTLHRVITERAPGAAQPLLNDLVTNAIGNASKGVASFGAILALLLALWGASGGVGSLTDSFNFAYEIQDKRGFIKRRAIVLGLTLATGLLVIAAIVMPLFAHSIGSTIARHVGLTSLFTLFWSIGSWVLAWFFIVLVLAVLYYFGPDIEQSFSWISPGSLVASIIWIIAILGFKLYLAVSNPASAYGAAGSVVVLLLFLWVTAIVFILGAEINAILQTTYDKRTIRDLVQHPEKTTPESHERAKERAAETGAMGGQAKPRQPKRERGGSSASTAKGNTPSYPRVPVQPATRGKGKGRGDHKTAQQTGGKTSPAGVAAAAGLFAAVVVQTLRGKKDQSQS